MVTAELPTLAYPPCQCPDCQDDILEDTPFLRIGFHGRPFCMTCGRFLLGLPPLPPAHRAPPSLDGYTVEPYDRGSFLVTSPAGLSYVVDFEEATCPCDTFLFRGPHLCKHFKKVILWLKN